MSRCLIKADENNMNYPVYRSPSEGLLTYIELKKEATGEGDRHIFIKKMARGV